MDPKTALPAMNVGKERDCDTGKTTMPPAVIASPGNNHLAEVEARLEAWTRALERINASLGTAPHAEPGATEPSLTDRGPRPDLLIQELVHFSFEDGWQGWSPLRATTLADQGVVEISRQNEATGSDAPGLFSPRITAPSHRLLRITIVLASAGDSDQHVSLLVTNEANDTLAHNLHCTTGTTEHFVFVSRRTRNLRMDLVCYKMEADFSFSLQSVAVDGIDMDSYQAQVRYDLNAPVIAAMASVPERGDMLADAVDSLLLQCDRVRVFLNAYPDIPDFLNHPRVDVRRSQDWDDKGDAGKFGWIDVEEAPGYRIAADDDIIFPPNFSKNTVAKVRAYSDHAFIGLHGVLLRQPIERYYAASSRTALHFSSRLTRDRTVHLLGTNALCYHSSKLAMRWVDFTHRNMADIFVALTAQKNNIPMISLARSRLWALQNRQVKQFETIYNSSLNTTGTPMDTSEIQDALLKRGEPLTVQPTSRAKVVICAIVTTPEEAQATFASWKIASRIDYDWAFIICQADNSPELHSWINEAQIPHEVHLLNQLDMSPAKRLARALELAKALKGDMLVIATDELRASNGQWVRAMLPSFENDAPLSMFGHRDGEGAITFGWQAIGADGALPVVTLCSTVQAIAAGDIDTRVSSLPDALGEWVVRLSLAGARGATAEAPPAPQDVATLHASSKQRLPLPVLPDRDQLRAKVGWISAPPLGVMRRDTLDDVFERICVLGHHPGGWDSMRERLARLGVESDRVVAVPHQTQLPGRGFEAYSASPLAPLPSEVRQVTSPFQLYRDYDSQAARLAYEEQRTERKAIASAGQWAYLAAWQNILETAVRDRVETLLVLQDDVYFHKHAPELFQAAYRELPDDWLAIQLGAFQSKWDLNTTTRRGTYIHQTDGVAVGSYAVGLRFDSLPFLLDLVKSRSMPFDLGALSSLERAYSTRCFLVKPNIAIQLPHDDNDDASGFLPTHAAPLNFHWHLPDYDIESPARRADQVRLSAYS